MKKKLLAVAISTLCFCGYANPNMDDALDLCVSIIDHTPSGPGKGKLPVHIPVIHQNGHTLCFQYAHPDYIINIMQDGEEVFSSVVTSDIVQYELPGYISGECIIHFVQGNHCFWAEIEL